MATYQSPKAPRKILAIDFGGFKSKYSPYALSSPVTRINGVRERPTGHLQQCSPPAKGS
jgi:hypothetical protein